MAEVQTAVNCLAALWTYSNAPPTFLDVLQVVSKFRLFEIPEILANILQRMQAAGPDITTSDEDEAADPQNATIVALQNFLTVPFEEIGPYADYVSGLASSAPHQGVKGLEFPRLMVVIDDEEARGFLFSYEKLFGAKVKSDTDAKNEAEAKETTTTGHAGYFT